MKHISIRLPWHDRGWDGCVCNNPSKNSYCKGFNSVNADRIRKDKDNKKEEHLKGSPFDASWTYHPPCTETINVFGDNPVMHTHYPKSFIKNTSPKKVPMPPGTSGTWPFEDMWEEDGERREPLERKKYVDNFFEELKQGGAAGLIFYYCNYDNPVSGEDKKYLLAGIARTLDIKPFINWDDIPKEQEKLYGGYIWTRQVENNPAQRMRLPYQEYIAMGKDARSIAVFAEGDLSRSFKYVARHVSDDDAISLIDKAIASVKTVINHAYFPQAKMDEWGKQLLWLQSIRKECWISRGLYPGLSSVLTFLGMERPEEFIRIRLKDLPFTEIRDYFFDRFKGNVPIGLDEREQLSIPKSRFHTMFHSQNEDETYKAKLCCDKLPLFDLDEEQVKNVLGDKRGMYSIHSSLELMYNNPYVIAEEYVGTDLTDFVNFQKIDHGMVPSEDLGNVPRIRLDNPDRLRCLMHSMLKEAALDGHTFIEFVPLTEKINQWHDLNDKAGIFNFDLTTWDEHKGKFSAKVVGDNAEGIFSIYLKRLHDAERKLKADFDSLIKDSGISSVGTNWKNIISQNGSTPSAEQVDALEKLYTNRLSVLTGTAGTGKTTVIQSLIHGIKETEPHHDFLLLAPTGKAALILRDRIKDASVKVLTIHGFLMKNEWINKNNFTLKVSGKKNQPSTVIVDECSMIEVALFATMLRALEMDNIERLILVGDYNQLPPIGPGKVFYDLISYLKKETSRAKKHLAELHYNWRQAQGSKASVLASHYARVAEIPDEAIFTEIEAGAYDISNPKNTSDLIIEYWKDEDDLHKKIPDVLQYAVARMMPSLPKGSLGEKYDSVHGIPFSPNKRIEAINVISPYRYAPSGVDDINLVIQETLRGKEAVNKFLRYGFLYNDKVLQVRNYSYWPYDHRVGKKVNNDDTYVPNGTLGFFSPNKKKEFQIKFPKDYDRYSFYPTKKQAREMLELGYATSVHKAQGSQFDITIMIIPEEDSDFLNREMLYTALTRSTKIQIILIQNNINILKSRLWLGNSDIVRRNSSLFSKSRGLPSTSFEKFKPESLIYEALPDIFVRSEGERIISQALASKEIGFHYEKPLHAKNNGSFKLPDFTFKYKRQWYYWEHNGMLSNFDYAQRAEKKRRWYQENGYQDTLIETPIEGMTLQQSIDYIFNNILNL